MGAEKDGAKYLPQACFQTSMKEMGKRMIHLSMGKGTEKERREGEEKNKKQKTQPLLRTHSDTTTPSSPGNLQALRQVPVDSAAPGPAPCRAPPAQATPTAHTRAAGPAPFPPPTNPTRCRHQPPARRRSRDGISPPPFPLRCVFRLGEDGEGHRSLRRHLGR